jgi:hypothetical protein
MTIDLEDRLYRELGGLARRADGLGEPVLDLPSVTARVGQRRRRRATARFAGLACCALLVVGGLFAIRSGHGGGSAAAAFDGAEEPLIELPDPAPFDSFGVTRPESVIGVRLADGQTLRVFEAATPSGDGYVSERCVRIGDVSMCPVTTGTAREPVLGGTSTLSYWMNPPPATARVEFRTTNGTRWQRPSRGVAAFTTTAHSPTDAFVAYDAEGIELEQAMWSTTSMATATATSSDGDGTQHTEDLYFPQQATQPEPPGVLPTMDDAQTTAYLAYADDTMRACLAADGDAAWTSCVQSTDAAVKAYAQTVRDQAAATTSTTKG